MVGFCHGQILPAGHDVDDDDDDDDDDADDDYLWMKSGDGLDGVVVTVRGK